MSALENVSQSFVTITIYINLNVYAFGIRVHFVLTLARIPL